MIILIDGPLCVGKTTIANMLAEHLKGRDVLVMDADAPEYRPFFRINKQSGDVSGTSIRYHTTFCRNFGIEINNQANLHEIVVAPICLEGKAAKECVADYLKERRKDVYHVILTVGPDKLHERVQNDDNASRQKEMAISEYELCVQYIEMYYKEPSLLIETDDITIDEAASIVLDKINKLMVK